MTAPQNVSAPRDLRRGLLIALGIAAVVLVASTVTTGILLFGMLGQRPAAAPAASASPSPTPTREPQTVHGIPVSVRDTALEFGTVVAAPWADGETRLFAPLSNPSETQAVSTFYDITAYDSKGRILDRTLGSADLLPGGEGVFSSSSLRAERDEVAEIVIEQTRISAAASPYTGEIGEPQVTADREYGAVDFVIPASLSPDLERPWADVIALVDGEIIGQCEAVTAEGARPFTGRCYLKPASKDVDEAADGDYITLPEDAEVRAFLRIELELE